MMDFSDALKAVKEGRKITRSGWNSKGMYVALHTPFLDPCLPYLVLRTVDGEFVPWTVSQTDVLAQDWIAGPEKSAVPIREVVAPEAEGEAPVRGGWKGLGG